MGGTWKWKTPYPGALPESDPRSGSEGTVESQMTKVGVNRPHCQTKKTKKLAGTPVPRKPLKFSMKRQCRSVNRNCCLGIWNLYFVFQFPNRRARRVIWILHGDIWILKSVQVPKSAARRGIWNLDDPRWFLETVQVSQNSVSGSPGVFEPVPPFFFLVSWKLGILESGKCDHFTGTACPCCMYARFPHAKGPCNVARPPARATAWPERASLQRAPRAARHRVGARSHPRRTG